MADTSPSVEQGIAQARAGERGAAYATLRRALFAEGDSAALRIWLAAVSPTFAEARTHLERALALEPANTQAQHGLRWVEQQLAAGQTEPPPPAAPAPPPAPLPEGEEATAQAPTPNPQPLTPDSNPQSAIRNLQLTCANCGMPANPGDRFCLRCGHPLGAPDAAPTPLAAEGADAPASVTIAAQHGPVLASRPLTTPRTGPLAALAGAMAAPPAEARPAPPAGGSRARSILFGGLLGLLVLLILGGIGVYAFAIQPAQQASADATAVAAAANAGATATVAATATAGAAAQATAHRAATNVAIPTVTAQAAAAQYYQHIAVIMQQVLAQDSDIEHTMQTLESGGLGPDLAVKQFDTYSSQNSDVKQQLAMLAVPTGQRTHHQAMTDALAARGRAITAIQQYIEDLVWMAIEQNQAAQAQQTLNDAQARCTQTKARADCNAIIAAQRDYDTANGQASRAQTYAEQAARDYDQNWAQYKQLMPAPGTGGDEQ